MRGSVLTASPLCTQKTERVLGQPYPFPSSHSILIMIVTVIINKHQKDSVCSSGPPEEEGGWSADAARSAERRQRGLQSSGPEPSCPPAASMAPQRKSDFSQIVLRALCTGACVSLVNACVAGECRPGGLRTQSRARHWGPGLSGSPWVA